MRNLWERRGRRRKEYRMGRNRRNVSLLALLSVMPGGLAAQSTMPSPEEVREALETLRRFERALAERPAEPHEPTDGLLAEEVAEVLPHLVSYDEEGKPYKVHYQMLTPLLLAEVQRQESEMAVLRRQMAERDRAVADLSERLDKLLKKRERFQR